jgi:hypothetical protein
MPPSVRKHILRLSYTNNQRITDIQQRYITNVKNVEIHPNIQTESVKIPTSGGIFSTYLIRSSLGSDQLLLELQHPVEPLLRPVPAFHSVQHEAMSQRFAEAGSAPLHTDAVRLLSNGLRNTDLLLSSVDTTPSHQLSLASQCFPVPLAKLS